MTKKTLPLWESHPENYQTNEDGTFKLKLDGTPKKKVGRQAGKKLDSPYKYTYSRTQQAKMKARREAKEAKAAAKKLGIKKANLQAKAKKKLELVDKLEGKSKDTIVETDTDLKVSDDNIIFKANEGPQEDFLAANETDVLYGGAAGGGKSYAMIVDPLRFVHRPKHRALILRRTMPELRELIDNTRQLYPKAVKGAKFREVEKIWTFPSGAKIEFGFLEREADVYRYQGQSFSWIGFDELPQMPTEFAWNYLSSRLRTTDPEITCYMRATANPGCVGSFWVKKRYIDPQVPNTSFVGQDGVSRKFIPARLEDNPHLTRDGQYEKMLAGLPPTLRKQLLEGDWDVSEGAAFTEFDPKIHVITPMEIPVHWQRLKGIDYGYGSESACEWGAIDPQDGTLIIFRELYRKGLTNEDLAKVLTQMEYQDPLSIPGILDPSCWQRRGNSGPTTAEALLKAGHKVRRADNSRVNGKIQVHEYLKQNPTGRPRLQIFNTCPNLIRELQSIPLSKKNPEDVDTNASDHAYDALRYLIMSRPNNIDPRSELSRLKRESSFQAFDSQFGY